MDLYKEIYSVKGLPVLQNKVYNSKMEAVSCPKGDVRLVQDLKTGLIYNETFDPILFSYDSDYQNEQSCSQVFLEHINDVACIINQYFRDMNLIEIGCGKGYFLEYLQKMGFNIIGFDPAYEGHNNSIVKESYDSNFGVVADGIIMRHVLEHIQEPLCFLDTIRKAVCNEGLIYIEVPCFDWICKNRAWFDIYYEHVNYFRLDDFYRLFEKVYSSGYLFGGQYIYIVAELKSLRRPTFSHNEELSMPDNFLGSLEGCISLYDNSIKYSAKKNKWAVWGGASKGVIFTLFMQKAGADIDIVIDINPAKQGKYLAGSGKMVYEPSKGLSILSNGDSIVVMNKNYFNEISSYAGNNYNYMVVDYEKGK